MTPLRVRPEADRDLDAAVAFLLQELRFWKLRRHPYLVFYVEQPDLIDVLRVLHAARDIPAALREDR